MNDLWVLHANLSGYITHGIEIEAEFELIVRKLDSIFLNETEMDKADPPLKITGYVEICRRDRDAKNREGGIAVFALSAKANQFTLLDKVIQHERWWI